MLCASLSRCVEIRSLVCALSHTTPRAHLRRARKRRSQAPLTRTSPSRHPAPHRTSVRPWRVHLTQVMPPPWAPCQPAAGTHPSPNSRPNALRQSHASAHARPGQPSPGPRLPPVHASLGSCHLAAAGRRPACLRQLDRVGGRVLVGRVAQVARRRLRLGEPPLVLLGRARRRRSLPRVPRRAASPRVGGAAGSAVRGGRSSSRRAGQYAARAHRTRRQLGESAAQGHAKSWGRTRAQQAALACGRALVANQSTLI